MDLVTLRGEAQRPPEVYVPAQHDDPHNSLPTARNPRSERRELDDAKSDPLSRG